MHLLVHTKGVTQKELHEGIQKAAYLFVVVVVVSLIYLKGNVIDTEQDSTERSAGLFPKCLGWAEARNLELRPDLPLG